MARNKTSVEEKYNAPFPVALRTLMEERCKTQENIAKMTGKTRQTVSQYVNGISEPGYDVLVKIADYFDVSLDYLLGRTSDPNRAPCAIDELGLSLKAVETIKAIEMSDTPNGKIQFGSASSHALDVLNCLLESHDFHEITANLLMCFESFRISANKTRKFEGDDYEFEAEMNDTGHIVLNGNDAARFYANEAANCLRSFACKEIPKLVDSCIQAK